MDSLRRNAVGLRHLASGLIAIAALAGSHRSDAIILARTGDPSANTTAPTNDPAGSGWNYEGTWGGYLGTPIAPHYFLSAAHIGQADSTFVFQNVTYTLAGGVQDPFSDLHLWQVNETFPIYAPMYAKSDEAGQRVVAIGRGTQRGSELDVNGILRGWNWGGGDGVKRWGENVVSQLVTFSRGNDGLYAIFDENGLTNECHFSTGDSGGAVFIDDGGVWKLAGINYGVDGYFYTDSAGDGKFIAALFNVGGFYYEDDSVDPPQYLQTPDPTPTGFYTTRVSSKLPWIYSVIDPAGVANSDGLPNLLEYAKVLNVVAPRGYGDPTASAGPGTVSITYRKILGNSALTYQVEQATTVGAWSPATTQDNVIQTNGNVQTVQSTVTLLPGQMKLFLQVQTTNSPGGPATVITRPVVSPAKRKS